MSQTISAEKQQATGSLQWLRKIQLVVGPKSGGQGIDLSQLRIVFHVRGAVVSTPNSMNARIYNLAPNTVSQIMSMSPSGPADIATSGNTFSSTSQVILNAGYENGPFGNIFQGSLVQVRAGRENQTDTYVDIFAQDGDAGHQFAVVNATLSAGHTPNDQYKTIGDELNNYGITTQPLSNTVVQNAAPRGKVFFGMARSYLNDLSRTHEFTWSVDNGSVVTLPYTDYRGGGAAIELTSMSGMIGMPELTDSGVRVKSLLNPIIVWGTRIYINNRVLSKDNPSGPTINLPAQYDSSWTGINYLPGAAADGYYKVMLVDHVGDTRGNEWYSNMTCIGLDSSALPMQAVGRGIVVPP
jgi:archaellin